MEEPSEPLMLQLQQTDSLSMVVSTLTTPEAVHSSPADQTSPTLQLQRNSPTISSLMP